MQIKYLCWCKHNLCILIFLSYSAGYCGYQGPSYFILLTEENAKLSIFFYLHFTFITNFAFTYLYSCSHHKSLSIKYNHNFENNILWEIYIHSFQSLLNKIIWRLEKELCPPEIHYKNTNMDL